jgi:hypothetical protein
MPQFLDYPRYAWQVWRGYTRDELTCGAYVIVARRTT